MAGTTRIGPKQPRKVYLAEWREKRGLTQKQLGDRLGVSDMTVSRWEIGTNASGGKTVAKVLPNTNVLAALAEALNVLPQDLYSHPDKPTADALLRDQPPEVQEQAFRVIEAIRKAH